MLILLSPISTDLNHAEKLVQLAWWLILHTSGSFIVVGQAGSGIEPEIELA
jgi:hypothetical protein